MTNELFQKNRYIFSKRKIKKVILNDDELVKQLRLFRKELKNYNIELKYLYKDVPSIEKKNIILNISKYICERKKIVAKMKKYKRVPLRDVAFETRAKEAFLERYKYYIVAYTILFLDDRFLEIIKYLRIEFRELDELSLVPVVDNTGSNLNKGLAMEEKRGKVVILTDQGEFLRIMDNGEWQIANEAIGKEYIGLRKHYKKMMIMAPLIAIVFLITSYVYSFASTTILIKSTSEIKVEINKLDRVLSVYSPTEKGKELVKSLNLKHKNVDKSISEILMYLEKNNMVPENNSIRIAVTGEALNFDKLKETNELVLNQSSKEKKYNLVVNNSGEDITLKPVKIND